MLHVCKHTYFGNILISAIELWFFIFIYSSIQLYFNLITSKSCQEVNNLLLQLLRHIIILSYIGLKNNSVLYFNFHSWIRYKIQFTEDMFNLRKLNIKIKKQNKVLYLSFPTNVLQSYMNLNYTAMVFQIYIKTLFFESVLLFLKYTPKTCNCVST